MYVIVIKEEHRESFAHLLPLEIKECLENYDTFALGLIQKNGSVFRPMGILVAKIESENAEILWINILPEARFMGHGAELVRFFLNLIENEKKASTVMAFASSDSDVTFFLTSCGFDVLPVGRRNVIDTTVGALTEGKLGGYKNINGVIPFSQVPNIHLRAFNLMARKHNISHESAPFPLNQNDYLPCSTAIITKDEITGLMLFSMDEGIGGISLVFQYAQNHDTKKLTALICSSVNAIKNQYPPETPIRFATMDKFTDIVANACTSIDDESTLLAFIYQTKGAENE